MRQEARVSVLHYQCGARELTEPSQLEHERTVVERRGQVSQGLALDRCQQGAIGSEHAVIAGGQRLAQDRGLLLCEPIRVSLSGVNHDRDDAHVADASCRNPGPGARGVNDLARLPEDSLATGRQGREDELRAILAGPIQNEIDSHPAPHAAEDAHLLEDLGVVRPGIGPMTEDARRSRPGGR